MDFGGFVLESAWYLLIMGWPPSMFSFWQRFPGLHIELVTVSGPRSHKGVLELRHSQYLPWDWLIWSPSKLLYEVHSFYFPLEVLFPTICSAVDMVSGASGAILWTSAGELGCGSRGAESKVRRNLAPAEITEPLKWLWHCLPSHFPLI